MNKKIKHIIGYCICLVVWMCLFSCRKDKYEVYPIASITVTNAIVGGPSIRLKDISTSISNNSSSKLSLMAGDFELYVYPVGDSLNPYYTDPKFYTENRDTYSLFLSGQSPSIASVILKDNLPYHDDSTCGVRFINLCSDCLPINITLSNLPATNEVSNLGYLQSTDFRVYSAKAATSTYKFQIRKSSDNSILMTYDLSTPRFANVTLVIRGMRSSVGIIRINNDR